MIQYMVGYTMRLSAEICIVIISILVVVGVRALCEVTQGERCGVQILEWPHLGSCVSHNGLGCIAAPNNPQI